MPAILDHRPHIHFTVPGSHLSGRSILWAGLAAGLAFLLLEMILMPLFMGASPWTPPRMIAAITLGRSALSPPDTFDSSVIVAAVVIHFALSLVYAYAFAFIAKGRTIGAATALGAGFGLLLYLVNFYGFALVFPWFAEARNWVSIVNHLVFGAVLGATYTLSVDRPWTHRKAG